MNAGKRVNCLSGSNYLTVLEGEKGSETGAVSYDVAEQWLNRALRESVSKLTSAGVMNL